VAATRRRPLPPNLAGRLLALAASLLASLVVPGDPARAAPCKVLAVMSYEPEFPWVQEIEAGIDAVLAGRCQVVSYYLNTKRDFAGGPQRAAEAFALYQRLAPDGVIAADDDAQAMFVVPYLAGKVRTPVMFCGVNGAAAQYGYPAPNVSGVLERLHIAETLALARQLVPSIRTVAFMMRDSPVAHLVFEQIEEEAGSYPVKVVAVRAPRTLAEATAAARELRAVADVLFLETFEGIPGDDGRPRQDREVMPLLVRAFGKSTVGSTGYAVRYGVLSAVVKTGQEQGELAARMLLEAMAGTPVSRLPITRNRSGKRMVNVAALKALGIHPRPVDLRGAELVRTVAP
jgi:ABC-type uncharacterized transport system substrate-binding protein